jgi:predicted nucleotidyltransferase
LEPFEIRAGRRRAVIAEAIEELCMMARGRSDVRSVIVFGSAASGKIGPTSDLDVVVVRDTQLPRTERADDLLMGIRAPVGVDMIVVTPSELRDALPYTTFGATILAEGREVYAA